MCARPAESVSGGISDGGHTTCECLCLLPAMLPPMLPPMSLLRLYCPLLTHYAPGRRWSVRIAAGRRTRTRRGTRRRRAADIYICMYEYVYTHMYIFIYAYTHICIHVYMYSCIYVLMCICIYCVCEFLGVSETSSSSDTNLARHMRLHIVR